MSEGKGYNMNKVAQAGVRPSEGPTHSVTVAE